MIRVLAVGAVLSIGILNACASTAPQAPSKVVAQADSSVTPSLTVDESAGVTVNGDLTVTSKTSLYTLTVQEGVHAEVVDAAYVTPTVVFQLPARTPTSTSPTTTTCSSLGLMFISKTDGYIYYCSYTGPGETMYWYQLK